MKRILIVCTTDSMIWNFLVPHIIEMKRRGYYVECASSMTGFYYKDIENHGIIMNEIPFVRSPYNLNNIKACMMLYRLIKERKIDTIFCHEPVGGAVGRLVGHWCGCKVIYIAHGFHFFRGAPRSNIVYYWVEKILSYYTDTLITINKEDYKAGLKFNSKKCYKLNGIGINTDKFTENNAFKMYLNDEFKLPENAVKILSVGELITRKNHKIIIEALAKINNPRIYYFIAGEGDLQEELFKTIHALKLDKKVFLLGYRTDIKELCNSSDIFALPSVHEGLSVALMEAMGCKKAVVASKIRGNVDLIRDNKGGYLCSTFNISEYVEAIKLLVDSPNRIEQFGIYNKDYVKKFDIDVINKKLMEIIEE